MGMKLPLPHMDPCYFCEVIAGHVDRWNVLEQSKTTITLLNGRQYEDGQCMVVPLRHAPTILDTDDKELADVMAAAKRLSVVLAEVLRPDGVLLYQNNGTGSGQEVPHFHLHVVPRRAGGDWGTGPPHIASLEQQPRSAKFDHSLVTDEKRAVASRLRRRLVTGAGENRGD